MVVDVSLAAPSSARVPAAPPVGTSLGRSTGVLLAGQGLRVLTQGAVFLLVARELGASAFGVYATVAAVAEIALCFTGFGLASVMVRDVARDALRARLAWSETVRLTVASGLGLSALGTLVLMASGLAQASAITVALLMVADTVGTRLAETVGLLWQAQGRSAYLATLPNVINGLRLLGILGLLALHRPVTLGAFAWIYLVAVLVPTCAAVLSTTRRFGWTRERLPGRRARIRTGLTFSASGASASVTDDIDKALIAALLNAQAVGIYAAAYRVLDMAYVPVRAIAAAAYPAYFRAGAGGVVGSLQVARRVVPWVALYGVSAGTLLWSAAPLITGVLGPDYSHSTALIQGLAALVALRGVGIMGGDALTGSDRNALRLRIQLGAAGLNIGLNLVLIPSVGVAGAVVATLISEAAFAAVIWASVLRAVRAERKMAARPSVAELGGAHA